MWDKRLVAVFALITATIGFLLGLAVGEWPGLRQHLYDYQALVAGFMAVVAATFTVQQMRQSDVRHQHRHDELIAIGMRHELLTVLRTHLLWTPQFIRWSREVPSFGRWATQAILRAREGDYEGQFSVAVFEEIVAACNSREVREVRRFLGPEASLLLTQIEFVASDLIARFKEFTLWARDDRQENAASAAYDANELVEIADGLGKRLSMLADQFEKLASGYASANAERLVGR